MDTIVACSTPRGQSGVALIRMSGSIALKIVLELSRRKTLKPRYAELRKLIHKDRVLDEALVISMPGPRSFTGEDVVEINCHGNPLIVDTIIEACVDLGARPARSGEFTRRALENGKLSLIQAESLNCLIHASSTDGVALAQQNMTGHLDEGISSFRNALLDACAELEARLDQPEGDLEYIEDEVLCGQLREIGDQALNAAKNWKVGRIRIHGAKVALLGSVNAGKSSLFNQLIGFKRAIVSDIPGTTRDVVEKSIYIDGLEICFFDTAGARESSQDPIESEGIAMGLSLAQEMDLCLLVFSLLEGKSSLDLLKDKIGNTPYIEVGTHSDRLHESINCDTMVSNINGDGISDLKLKIRSRLSERESSGAQYQLVSQRQYELFLSLSEHCFNAAQALEGFYGPAIAAEEITEALERLAELSGEEVREAVLDRLFTKFCIGK
ncbi:MAG: tRNA uridine-5-carboxymethylaminomethyl(34) synthesis GTPase MnmE [Myxococcota bacterium]|nr:tRNA uridine-5-carboxymethylaminomethyl(34) synthesis GTPase MnmE [Myxococcota bacterium]